MDLSGAVIAALDTMICTQKPFSDGREAKLIMAHKMTHRRYFCNGIMHKSTGFTPINEKP